MMSWQLMASGCTSEPSGKRVINTSTLTQTGKLHTNRMIHFPLCKNLNWNGNVQKRWKVRELSYGIWELFIVIMANCLGGKICRMVYSFFLFVLNSDPHEWLRRLLLLMQTWTPQGRLGDSFSAGTSKQLWVLISPGPVSDHFTSSKKQKQNTWFLSQSSSFKSKSLHNL